VVEPGAASTPASHDSAALLEFFNTKPLPDAVHSFAWKGGDDSSLVFVDFKACSRRDQATHLFVVIVDSVSHDFAADRRSVGEVDCFMVQDEAGAWGFPGGDVSEICEGSQFGEDTFTTAEHKLERVMSGDDLDGPLGREAREHMRRTSWLLKRRGCNQADSTVFVVWCPPARILHGLPFDDWSDEFVGSAWRTNAQFGEAALCEGADSFVDVLGGAMLIDKMVACTRSPGRHTMESPPTSDDEDSGSECRSDVEGSSEEGVRDVEDTPSQPPAGGASVASMNAWLRSGDGDGARRAHPGGDMVVSRGGVVVRRGGESDYPAREEQRSGSWAREERSESDDDEVESEEGSLDGAGRADDAMNDELDRHGESPLCEAARVQAEVERLRVEMELVVPMATVVLEESIQLATAVPAHLLPSVRSQSSPIFAIKMVGPELYCTLVVHGDTWVIKGALKHLRFRWHLRTKQWRADYSLELVRQVAALQVGTIDITFCEDVHLDVNL
jgi:hypothetical protein